MTPQEHAAVVGRALDLMYGLDATIRLEARASLLHLVVCASRGERPDEPDAGTYWDKWKDAEAKHGAAQREADIQLGEKLAAQMTLKSVCDVLNLPMVSLGNGWTEATPKILARIEEMVDEAECGFRERDRLAGKLQMVHKIATRGVGPDTTPEEALKTIAAYIVGRGVTDA